MKRGATKEDIIHATQELIAQNGIRAVRVDEIAQRLGISKRTLYEMFSDKDTLVNACLDYMSQQQQLRVANYRKRRSGNELQKALRMINEYIDGLFTVESSFLADIRRKVTFAEHYLEHREFWVEELTQMFDACRKAELLLTEIDAASFADQLINTLFELRLGQTTREELYLFSRTILRGAATRQGIELLDSKL